ncbi:hypothetical protein SAMN05216360_110137 [Methylobacterium phyllostachyos]|uniref:Uncharacterized protein n=1 Tax=Methylobacterium phyllostachyos TaxID=582672 RepID=A0A1H0DF52_9HYPH|nr:hypothetical protein [Methylobacterium phyllostachyos]SDN68646.1 hypothetical protein SAMN05216360_110137 [Methylobacterium phyllostachyos]
MPAVTSPSTRRWGRRTGRRARLLALALVPVLMHAAACPAAAGSVAASRGAISMADEPEIPARLTVAPDGRALQLVGDLTAGVAARVSRLLAAHPEIERLDLTSDGGLVEEGAAIGALVAARGLATSVPDACASACTLIFVRGRTRLIAADGRLGFHAPYVIGAHGKPRPVDAAAERAAYRAAGLPPAFVARALAVPPAGIWIPDAAQLCAAGIVTDIVGATDPVPRGTGGATLQRAALASPEAAPRSRDDGGVGGAPREACQRYHHAQ